MTTSPASGYLLAAAAAAAVVSLTAAPAAASGHTGGQISQINGTPTVGVYSHQLVQGVNSCVYPVTVSFTLTGYGHVEAYPPPVAGAVGDGRYETKSGSYTVVIHPSVPVGTTSVTFDVKLWLTVRGKIVHDTLADERPAVPAADCS